MSTADRKKLAINNGILLGIISIVSVVIQYLTGDYTVGGGKASTTGIIFGILNFAIGITVVCLAMSKLRKLQGGYMTLGESFKLGFTIYIISSLFIAIWMFIYCYVLEPDYQQQMLAQTAQSMHEQNPNMSDEQINTTIHMTSKFTSPWMMAVFSILGAAFFGSIISLIAGAIFKRNKPAYLEQAETEA